MASVSRRLASIVAGVSVVFAAGVAGTASLAYAADPITSDPAPTLTGPTDDPFGVTIQLDPKADLLWFRPLRKSVWAEGIGSRYGGRIAVPLNSK